MKNWYVSGLQDGTRVDDVFLVVAKSMGYTHDGSPFMRLKLSDRTGVIDAIKWDVSEDTGYEVSNDQFLKIRGVVTTYNGKQQVKIDSFRPYNDKIDPTDFLPRAERDIEEMLAELMKFVRAVEHPQLKALLDYFFSDQNFLSRYSSAPAAQKIHHAYIGGLLEHSLSVAVLCDFVASHYSGIDKDLLMTGAILHDIGKIEEFCWDKSIRYSDAGHLVGHVVGGATMIGNAIDNIKDFQPLLKLVLIHMILSHHGQKDWGSPKRPKCLESIILHYVEDLDAKVNTFQLAAGKGEPVDEKNLWTERHWVFDRPLFKGLPRSTTDSSSEASFTNDDESDYDPFADE